MICQLIGILLYCNSQFVASFPQNPVIEEDTRIHARYISPENMHVFNGCNDRYHDDDDKFMRCIQKYIKPQ